MLNFKRTLPRFVKDRLVVVYHISMLAAVSIGVLYLTLAHAAATSHSFSTHQIASALYEKQHLTPGSQFSINTSQGSALVRYDGVVEMTGSNRYAIVITVSRW